MKRLFIAFLAGILAACNLTATSSDDDSTYATASQLAALQQQVQALQAQVAALPASSPAVWIKAPNAKAYATRRVTAAYGGDPAQTRSVTCTGIGTLTGRPTTSDPVTTGVYAGVSCTGYYFRISGAASASQQAFIQPVSNPVEMDFDGPNCTGNAYLRNFATVSVVNGLVFTLNPQTGIMGGSDWSNPSNYWYVAAGQAPSTPTVVSVVFAGSPCQNLTQPFTASDAYLVKPNDPTVTGIQSAPVTGPVLISQ